MDRLEALLRGGAQGATAGWGDEAVSKLLGVLPGPDDPEGYSREYAAGSPDQDYRNVERAENAAAAEKYPVNYNVGQLLGAAPMSIAAAPLAEGVAGAGAVGAGLGGLSGAGSATEGNRAAGGLLGAGIGGALGAGGAALGNIKAPLALEPAYATAGIAPATARGSNPVQSLLNMSSSVAPREAIMPPFEAEVASETIPKPGRTLRESDIPRMEDIVDEAGDSQSLRDRALIDRSLKREPREINRDQEYYNDLIGRYEKRVEGRVKEAEPVTVEKQTPNSVEKATVRPPKRGKPASVTQTKETVGPGTKAVEQMTLSGVEEPKYSYHATPKDNAQSIAELGLRPEEGGKNFAFKKNQGRVYMSGEQDAPMWAEKLKDFSGQEPLQLRTPLSAETPPGASPAVKVRTEPVPPERLQYRTPSGSWKAVTNLKNKEELPAGTSANQLDIKDLLGRF